MPYQDVIRRYEKGIESFESALKGMPGSLIDRPPAPGKWSIRQIAAHLADAELVLAARIRWIAAEPGARLAAFDQDRWAKALSYQEQDLKDSLALFRALRKSTATMLRSLPESAWTNKGQHEERGDVSLLEFVNQCSDHAESHARQINNIRSSLAASA